MKPGLRAALWAGIAVVLAAGGAFGYRGAIKTLKEQVELALGPESRVDSIEVGLGGVTVHGLRVRAPAGWPAAETLRAERVTISPSVAAALTGRLRVASIQVHGPYLSVLRGRDEKLRLLPSLLERPAPAPAGDSAAATEVSIGRVELHGGAVDFYDASVRQPALKISLRDIELELRELVVPALTGRTDFEFTGTLKGRRHDGRIEAGGWAEIGSRDSSIQLRLTAVDLAALEPYLLRAAEAGVERGSLDFEIASEVRQQRLKAPGRVVITGLKLREGGGTFMGMSRKAVLLVLKDRDDRIAVNFVLQGDLDNPSFSLNEMFGTQVATSIAGTLGVSIADVAQGLGTAGQRSVKMLDDAATGLTQSLRGVFGKKPAEPEADEPER